MRSAARRTPFYIPFICFAFTLTSVLSDTSCHREMAFGKISTFRYLHTRCAPGKTGTIFGTFNFVHVTNEKTIWYNKSRTKLSITAVISLVKLLIIIVYLLNVFIIKVFVCHNIIFVLLITKNMKNVD